MLAEAIGNACLIARRDERDKIMKDVCEWLQKNASDYVEGKILVKTMIYDLQNYVEELC